MAVRNRPVPAQLQADVAAFTGREAELAALDLLLAGVDGASGVVRAAAQSGPGDGAVPIAVLAGTAGVGKTALAVRWARRAAAGFPDGQLYVNLRGYDPDTPVAHRRTLTTRTTHRLVPRQEQPLQVGLRTTAREHPVGIRPEPDPPRGPVDQPPLDQRPSGALIPRVQRGIDAGQHHLAEQRGDDDRAVEVREVARVVEVDRVAQVHAVELVQRGARIPQRRVQIDRADHGFELRGRHSRERPARGGDPRRDPLGPRRDPPPIGLRGVGRE